jgi:hypothetical protein
LRDAYNIDDICIRSHKTSFFVDTSLIKSELLQSSDCRRIKSGLTTVVKNLANERSPGLSSISGINSSSKVHRVRIHDQQPQGIFEAEDGVVRIEEGRLPMTSQFESASPKSKADARSEQKYSMKKHKKAVVVSWLSAKSNHFSIENASTRLREQSPNLLNDHVLREAISKVKISIGSHTQQSGSSPNAKNNNTQEPVRTPFIRKKLPMTLATNASNASIHSSKDSMKMNSKSKDSITTVKKSPSAIPPTLHSRPVPVHLGNPASLADYKLPFSRVKTNRSVLGGCGLEGRSGGSKGADKSRGNGVGRVYVAGCGTGEKCESGRCGSIREKLIQKIKHTCENRRSRDGSVKSSSMVQGRGKELGKLDSRLSKMISSQLQSRSKDKKFASSNMNNSAVKASQISPQLTKLKLAEKSNLLSTRSQSTLTKLKVKDIHELIRPTRSVSPKRCATKSSLSSHLKPSNTCFNPMTASVKKTTNGSTHKLLSSSLIKSSTESKAVCGLKGDGSPSAQNRTLVASRSPKKETSLKSVLKKIHKEVMEANKTAQRNIVEKPMKSKPSNRKDKVANLLSLAKKNNANLLKSVHNNDDSVIAHDKSLSDFNTSDDPLAKIIANFSKKVGASHPTTT